MSALKECSKSLCSGGAGAGEPRDLGLMTAPLPLIGLSPAELAASLEVMGLEPKPARMRASQLWNWVYVHGRRDFAAMTNLAKDFRARVAETMSLARPEVVTEQISEDGTRKWLLRTEPGIEFETVY